MGVFGGALAAILATYAGGILFGWGEGDPPPPRPPQGQIVLRVEPHLLRLKSGERTISITVSGLTPNGPVGEEIDGPLAGVRGTRLADDKGELAFTKDIDTDVAPGSTYRITINDQATGALAIAHIQLVDWSPP